MLDVLMLFPRSADPDRLAGVLDRLVPSLQGARGLRSLKVSHGELMAKGSRPEYAAVVELSFDSLADWMAAIPTAERQDERDAFDEVDPLVLFFEVRQP